MSRNMTRASISRLQMMRLRIIMIVLLLQSHLSQGFSTLMSQSQSQTPPPVSRSSIQWISSSTSTSSSTTTQLAMRRTTSSEWASAMTTAMTCASVATVMGWTLGDINTIPPAVASSTTTTTVVRLPSTSYSYSSTTMMMAAVDTMDFSLPSYDEAKQSGSEPLAPSSKSKNSAAAPLFNPFADFEPQVVKPLLKDATTTTIPDDTSATESKPSSSSSSSSFFKVPAFKLPELTLPKNIPSLELPSEAAGEAQQSQQPPLKLPSIALPELKVPEVKLPEFKVPEVKVPEIKVPEIKVPASLNLDKIKLPSFPSLPSLSGAGDASSSSSSSSKRESKKSDLPPTFTLEAPSSSTLPKVSLPSITPPSSSLFPFGAVKDNINDEEDAMDNDVSQPPQEVRDAAARLARQDFLADDADAKQMEQQAREARQRANAKRKLAQAAKDVACETRPGGKWICVRNPFTAGF